MIMLPLYGQYTAAFKIISMGRLDFKFNTKRHVFDKQVKIIFAELLIKIIIQNLIINNIILILSLLINF